MQLMILGMHRSGTSMQTRLLNLAGAYFGPEGSNTGANEENPKGFWERRDVRALNDMVLHSTGADWDRAVDLDLGMVPADTLERFNRTASRIVLDMDAHRPWVMKEPRLCLLLPLWRALLECPVAVNVFRHPLEVASSLKRRNGIPIEVGVAMWKLYVRAADRGSRGMPCVTSLHRDFVTRPYEATCELIEALQHVGVQGLRLPMRQETEAFVSPELYREKLSALEFDRARAAPVIEVFEELARTGRPPEGIELTDEEVATLRRYEAGLPQLECRPSVRTPAEEKIAELSEALARTNRGVDRRNARITELEEKTRSLVGDRQRLEEKVRALAEERHRLEEQLEAERLRHDEAREAAEAEHARLQLECATREIQAGRAQAEAVRERGESAQKTAEITRMTRLLIARERQLQERADGLRHERRTRASRERELKEVRVQLGELQRRSSAELQAYESKIQRMRGSVAWKVSAPIRWVAGRVAAARGVGVAGDRKLVERSGLFDRAWYEATYPDVKESRIDPIEHYLQHGSGEGRDPGPGFSTTKYLQRYPDVGAAGTNPLLHFIRHGRGEGRLPK